MSRHMTFRWAMVPTVEQARALARHEGAARFAFNQGLRLHLNAREASKNATDDAVKVPWTGFDLINAFNRWKRSEGAGRRFVVDHAGTAEAEVTGLAVLLRGGRWRISLNVEAADLHPAAQHPARDDADRGGWAGVDRGLHALVVAATADGAQTLRVATAPRALRAAQPKTRRLQKAVARKVKGSANRRAAVARLARHHERVRARRHHFLHHVSNLLVKTHDRLVIEDLNITGMLANHRLAAAISDAAWGELARQITYKQAWRGGQVLAADRWFPSSKTCSRCGDVTATLTLADRVFACENCGHTLDRDLNAAVNLATWGERHNSQVLDPEARGQVTNARRRGGSGRRSRADETSPDDVGTLTATAA